MGCTQSTRSRAIGEWLPNCLRLRQSGQYRHHPSQHHHRPRTQAGRTNSLDDRHTEFNCCMMLSNPINMQIVYVIQFIHKYNIFIAYHSILSELDMINIKFISIMFHVITTIQHKHTYFHSQLFHFIS